MNNFCKSCGFSLMEGEVDKCRECEFFFEMIHNIGLSPEEVEILEEEV